MKHSDFEHLPALGAGIGLRKQHFNELRKTSLPVGFLEVVPENFMNFGGYPQTILELVSKRWPIVSHGVNLSIGSVDPLNDEYLERLKTLLQKTKALWYSDHMCFTSVGGEYFHDLLPLPTSFEAADHVIRRVKQLQKKIDLPFLLENPSYYIPVPGAQMSEPAFFTKVLEEADCGMLLDVNNVYVNSKNHGFDPKEYIRQLPLHRVGQIHMAGHQDAGDVIIDTHEGPIIDPVWDLYQFAIEAIGRPVTTLIEWDTNIPPLAQVVDEALHAESIVRKLGLSGAASAHPVADFLPEVDEMPTRLRLAERREAVGAGQ